ncbi:hypothetical protein ACTHPH_21545 [Paenibacillus pasadenensis]|uniref:hypothetical protein n=1 Tax=Paenibacillus pasadenensis TaxID=217090 RepID=UPI0004106243|nr:hypothetical protein [Paenibacillus pasadenensis]
MIKKVNLDSIPELEKVFQKVFKNKNPFESVFANEVEQKIILFPTDGYYLNEKQYNALMSAILSINENIFIISEIEGDCFSKPSNEQGYQQGHWVIDANTSYNDYCNLTLPLENAIYSSNGKWGVIISHEEHALLGGEGLFVSTFKLKFPDWSSSKSQFLEQWETNQRQYNSKTDWIPSFLQQFE